MNDVAKRPDYATMAAGIERAIRLGPSPATNITFIVDALHRNVVLPDFIVAKYAASADATVPLVLNNRFWNLKLDGTAFSVDLSFGGIVVRCVIPFEAITVWIDLRPDNMKQTAVVAQAAGNVVSLDEFRKKRA